MEVLTTVDDYLPGVPLTVLWELDWTFTKALLAPDGGALVPVPGDYDTFAVEFAVGSAPRYALLFVPMNPETGLRRDRRYVLRPDGQFFTGESGLVVASIRPLSDGSRPVRTRRAPSLSTAGTTRK